MQLNSDPNDWNLLQFLKRSLRTYTTLGYLRNKNFSSHKLQQLRKTQTQQNLRNSGIINNPRIIIILKHLKNYSPKLRNSQSRFQTSLSLSLSHARGFSPVGAAPGYLLGDDGLEDWGAGSGDG